MLETIAQYRVQEELGRGGMAVVYKAVDENTNKLVAVKILYEQWTMKTEVVQRFWREVKVTGQLVHPNIVNVLDYGEFEGRPYLVMPYLAGGSLAQYFRKPVNVSLKTTTRLLVQIATALDYAHEHGVVHRDLKLENILLDAQKKPMLGDFGVARLRDGTRLTMTGMVTGTPMYMAPEQATGRPDIDQRVDVYGLAVMAYLMTTGFYPFSGDDALAILHQHLNAVPPMPSTVNPELPPAVDVVIMRGLAKKPEERYMSAGEFAKDLRKAVAGPKLNTRTMVNIRAPNPEPARQLLETTAESPGLKKKRVRRLIGIGGVAVLVIVLGVIGLLALLDRDANRTVDAPPTVNEAAAATRVFARLTETAGVEFTIETRQSTTVAGRPTLPASWTPEPTYTDAPTATITPTPDNTENAGPLLINGEMAIAATVSTDGRMWSRPTDSLISDVISWIDEGTAIYVIGRLGGVNWLEIVLADDPDVRGWMRTVSIALPEDADLTVIALRPAPAVATPGAAGPPLQRTPGT